ncbi:E3 ubiquitin-protein ligase bre1 [Histomonas meleagridis]|uniref:E3 ubiquitin-protein ligase bre1 n=1 Tax=Histomonas meleagridis TaxID=135588 RepID=UPI00355A0F72|nr:E3 ubiquitin-protein ligase bre1 [Histomonas meleagridis]KAH0798445.1 E3 ubiquitin-protein ligase bre1 [Histomonas meleagridis]
MIKPPQTDNIPTVQNFIPDDLINGDGKPDIQEQIKQMEFNIEQNRKRSEILSNDCYEIIRNTELLAFDFMFSCYLIGEISSDGIYKFLDDCIRPSFVSSGKVDYELAQAHIKDLQNLICDCAKILSKTEYQQPDYPRRTSEFTLYLKDQQMRLDHEFQKLSSTPNEENQDNEEETNEPIDSLPPAFIKWLYNELNSGLSSSSEETLELRYLIRNIANRLSAIAKLKESIQEMKSQNNLNSQIDVNIYSEEDLFHSPFFIGLKTSCSFLLSALNLLKSQNSIIPQCVEVINSIHHFVDNITQNVQSAISEMQQEAVKLDTVFSQKQSEEIELRKEIQPYLEQLLQLLFGKPTRNASTYSDSIYSSLQIKLRNELLTKNQDSEEYQNVANQLKIVSQIQAARVEISHLTSQQNQILDQIADKERALLHILVDRCKLEYDEQNRQSEDEQIQEYEKGISSIINSLNLPEVFEWKDRLFKLCSTLNESINVQQKILNELQNHFDKKDIEVKIAEKRKEVDELSALNYRMCLEIGRSQLELDSLVDEKEHTQQEIEIYKMWLPDCIDQYNRNEVDHYREMLICPICKENVRDTILASCGHVMCRMCLQKSGEHKCLICDRLYDESQLKPFFFQ